MGRNDSPGLVAMLYEATLELRDPDDIPEEKHDLRPDRWEDDE